MVDRNDALLREVQEELQRERMAKLWDRYGGYLLVMAAVVIAFVGGYQLWQARQRSIAETGAAQYEAAVGLLATGKTDEARKALEEISAGSHAGYAGLSELRLAGADLKAGKTAEALAAFDKIATSGTADESLRNFAAIQAAALKLGTADFTELQNRLNDLVNGTSAWRIPARELLGTAAFKAGNYAEARTLLQPLLADPQSSRGVTNRVRVIMDGIASAELSKRATPVSSTPAAAVAPAASPAAPQAPPK